MQFINVVLDIFFTKEKIRPFKKEFHLKRSCIVTLVDEKFSNNGILQKYPVYERNV